MSGAYFGSKATSGLCQPIIAMMPPHDTYIESHLGGGAIMKRKPPAQRNIGIRSTDRVADGACGSGDAWPRCQPRVPSVICRKGLAASRC